MTQEEQKLREYFDAAQPSADFRERLRTLEPRPRPQQKYLRRVVLAAAACLALGFFGWYGTDLSQRGPNVAQIPATDEIRQTAPDTEAAASETTDAPHETTPVHTEATEAAATEAAETEGVQESSAPLPTVPPTAGGVVPPTEAPPPAPEEPVMGPLTPEEPVMGPLTPEEEAPTQESPELTQPQPPISAGEIEAPPETVGEQTILPTTESPSGDQAAGDGQDPIAEGDSFFGWYQRSGSREYVYVQSAATGETEMIDVTGQLTGGSLTLQVVLFGRTMTISVYRVEAAAEDDPQEDLVDEQPEEFYDVIIEAW